MLSIVCLFLCVCARLVAGATTIAASPIYVDPMNGTDAANNGTDPTRPLRSFGAVANLVTNVLFRSTPGVTEQRIFLRAGVYSGDANCAFLSFEPLSSVSLIISSFDDANNDTMAVFSCGVQQFNTSVFWVHKFEVDRFSMSLVTYRDTELFANGSIAAFNRPHQCRLTSLGHCFPTMVFVSVMSTAELTNVALINNTMHRGANLVDLNETLTSAPLYALASNYYKTAKAKIANFVAENNSAVLSSCVMTPNGERPLLNAWSGLSAAPLALIGLNVSMVNSSFVGNSAIVVDNMDSNEVMCAFAVGGALLLVDLLPRDGAMISSTLFERNSMRGDRARMAGAAVAVMTGQRADFAGELSLGVICFNCTFAENALHSNISAFGGAVVTGFHTATVINEILSATVTTITPQRHDIALANCTFAGNRIVSGRAGGGAVFSPALRLFGCNFTNNELQVRRGGGGAIMTERLAANDTVFVHNLVTNDRLFPDLRVVAGGAWAVPSVLNSVDPLFTGCILLRPLKNKLARCNFTDNEAGVGGAIFASLGTCGSMLSVSNCSASTNGATYGSFLYAVGSTIIHVFGTDFVGNTARLAGTLFVEGAHAFELFSSTFRNNTADVGPALYSDSVGTVSIMFCTFSFNDGVRGGVVQLIETASSAAVLSTVFHANVADEAFGGALALTSLVSSGDLTIQNVSFVGNRATLGGAVYASIGASALSIINCTFARNDASIGGALMVMRSEVVVQNVAFVANSATQNGGAVAIDRSSVVTFSATSINASSAGQDGGGVWLRQSELSGDVSFHDNEAGGRGGGIAAVLFSDVLLADSDFVLCHANLTGGGVFLSESNLGLSNSKALLNRGASFQLDSTSARMIVMRAEDTVKFGGGFLSIEDGGEAFLQQVTIANNFVPHGVGGAIRCDGCDSLALLNTTLVANLVAAGLGGGALFLQSSNGTTLMFKNVLIAKNQAAKRQLSRVIDAFTVGGGIMMRADDISDFAIVWENVTVDSNTADLGGGICIDSGDDVDLDATEIGVTLTRNRAHLVGGGAFVTANATDIIRVLLQGTSSGNNTAECYGDDIGSGPTALNATGQVPTTAMRGVPVAVQLEERDMFGRLTVCTARGGARTVFAQSNDVCNVTSASVCSIGDTVGVCTGSFMLDGPVGAACTVTLSLHVSDILSPVVASLDLNVSVVACSAGYGVDADMHCHECPDGTYNLLDSDGVCRPCPSVGAVCRGSVVSAREGFWLFQDGSGEISSFDCERGACLEAPPGERNKCGGGRSGLLCASCLATDGPHGHFFVPTAPRASDGSMCMVCDEPTWWVLLLLGACIFGLALYLHFSVQGSSSRLKILFNFTQSATQVLPRGSVNEVFTMLSLRAARGSPVLLNACVLPVGPLTMQAVQLLVPALLVVSLLSVFAVQRLLYVLRGPTLIESDSGRVNADADAAEPEPSARIVVDPAPASDGAPEIPTDVSIGTDSSLRASDGDGVPARRWRAPTIASFESTVFAPRRKGDTSFFSTDRLVRSLIFFALLSYTTLLQTTLSILWCRSVGDVQVLVVEPSESCVGERYERARSAALFGMLPVVIAMPVTLGAVLLLWNRRNKLILSRSAQRVADIDVRFGVLYENYKHSAFLWEAFNLLRRLAMALVTIFLSSDERAFWMSVLCFAILAATASAKPFVNELENRLELAALTALLVFSIFAQSEAAFPRTSSSVLGALALVVAVLLALTVVLRERTVAQLRRMWAWIRRKAMRRGGRSRNA
jgi:predicted outer membrane repeat protein